MKNTLEVFKLAITLKDAITKAKEDGKVNFTDALLLVDVIPALLDAIADIEAIPAEWKDGVSPAEQEALVAEFGELVKDEKIVQLFEALIGIPKVFVGE